MEAFTAHRGVAAPLLRDNIDTDAIIPSREMRRVSKQGLGVGLFAHWRYLDVEARSPDPAFVLNQPAYTNATILIAGANFGCGSSREHAVWALTEFGIRAVVAPSFSPIFHKNCIANGVLPAVLEADAVQALARSVESDPQANCLTVDLHEMSVASSHARFRFHIDLAARRRLLEGLDPIAFTQTAAADIDAFEAARFKSHPWAQLAGTDDSDSDRR